MSPAIIADSSCLIALDRIDQLTLLKNLFTKIILPDAVAQEFGKQLDWFVVKNVVLSPLLKLLMTQVDYGESEVIALALDTPNSIAIIDDKKARRIAKDLEVKVMGTVTVLIKAKQVHIIPEVKPLLDDLNLVDFRLSKSLYLKALALANEVG
jgi:predicted nucleic acid-binding protein